MKKFIALALALAMMVSCLVFTSAAEAASGIEVKLEGPTSIEPGATFTVKVRVSDEQMKVGGIQATIDVTGATLKTDTINVNSEVLAWNQTEAKDTIYKVENNDLSFAALNELNPTSYETRAWFILEYVADADAESVSVNLTNVKISDKSANLINDYVKSDLAINVIDPETEPVLTVVKSSILKDQTLAQNQGLTVEAVLELPENTDVDEFGVVFYPTSLLGGKELTIDNEDAIVASVVKGSLSYDSIIANGGNFAGILNFGFDDPDTALKFLGTRVTARVYYKVGDEVVYASNNLDSYVKNGVSNKAALNTIIDYGKDFTDAEYVAATKNLSSATAEGLANRAFVLKTVIEHAAASSAK